MFQKTISFTPLGNMPFNEAWTLQKKTHKNVASKTEPDRLFTVEHPHVYTFSKASDLQYLHINQARLEKEGIELIEIDRGGSITYHGYGQLIAYPILNMTDYYMDAHRYLRDLEECIIKTLATFNIVSERKTSPMTKHSYTGVWVGEEKICAIGVKFSQWTTMHGLALNVNTNLDYFNYISPCGISDKAVTSMNKLLGKDISLKEVESAFLHSFENVFGVSVQLKPLA